jgi:hypothetical protein
MVDGPNRLAVRNTVVYVNTVGVGCRVNDTSAVLALDGCIINGGSSDILRNAGGNVIVSMTELVNRTTNFALQTYITAATNPAGGFAGMLWLDSVGVLYSHV